jgi:predicted GNAT superfamily acetyltransferase
MHLRDLTTLEDYRAVVDLEREIWGFGPGEDTVPLAILAVSVKRGGILIGGFEDGRMVGFVYSLAGLKDGRPTQWSHMLGVVERFRGSGLGHALKVAQRERALARGLDLIEWTYDPLQAANAHLNFRKLGVVVEEYAENIYGESSSPLHGRTPTDRFIAQWWIGRPHVVRRLETAGPLMRAAEVADAPVVNRTKDAGRWLACDAVDLSLTGRRLLVEIPVGFTEMLAGDARLAHTWRLATREIFQHYFSRGYRAVDFFLDRANGRGAYLLAREEA